MKRSIGPDQTVVRISFTSPDGMCDHSVFIFPLSPKAINQLIEEALSMDLSEMDQGKEFTRNTGWNRFMNFVSEKLDEGQKIEAFRWSAWERISQADREMRDSFQSVRYHLDLEDHIRHESKLQQVTV